MGVISFVNSNKTIQIDLNNSGFSNKVQSKIKFYYCEVVTDDNTITDIKELGYSNIEDTTINIDDTTTGIYLLFKYDDDRLNATGKAYQEIEIGSNIAFNKYVDTIGYHIFITNGDTNYYLFTDNVTSISHHRVYENYYHNLDLSEFFTEENYTVNSKVLCSEDYPQTLEIVANNGYFFSGTIEIVFARPSGMGYLYEEFTLSEDSKKLSFTFTDDYINYYIDSIDTPITEKETIISNSYGLVSLYKPSNDILKQLATKKFYEYENVNKDLIDLSKYIISILSLPLDVETIGSKTITLNSINTEIESEYIDNNILLLDFGSVDIQGFYHNSLDYTHTEIELYLAFIGLVKLDTSKYMNKQINLQYKIDLFTGDFIAMLFVDNIIYDSFSGNLSIQIPYITQVDKGVNVSGYKNNNNNMLTDRECKIIITSNNINDTKIKNTNLFIDKLSDLQGYNVIENFDTSDYLLKIDFENISNLLSQGVIF